VKEALAHLGLLRQKQTNKAKVKLRSITSSDHSVSRNSATLDARVNNRSIFARIWVYTRLRYKTNNFNIFNKKGVLVNVIKLKEKISTSEYRLSLDKPQERAGSPTILHDLVGLCVNF